MSKRPSPSPAERFNDHEAVEAAIRRAVREAVLEHARAGRSIAVWREGQVVWLEPAEVLAQFANEPTERRGD
jgi:hypothetical protein